MPGSIGHVRAEEIEWSGRQGLRGAGLAPDLLLPGKYGSERNTFFCILRAFEINPGGTYGHQLSIA